MSRPGSGPAGSGWVVPRQSSLKGRLRVGFLVIWVLLIPILVLSVYYLHDLMSQTTYLDTEIRSLRLVVGLRGKVEDNLEAGRPLNAGVDAILAELAGLGIQSDALQEQLVLAAGEAELASRCNGLLDLVLATTRLGAQGIPSCPAGIERSRLLRELDQLASIRLTRTLKTSEQFESVADDAVRNLVALAMLIVGIMAYFTFRFPRRFMGSLHRFANFLRQAEGGRTDIHIPRFGVQEVDDMAQSFNGLLVTLREFDEKKRSRIVLDRQKIEHLLERLEGPAAVVAPNLSLESCNTAMLTLLQSPESPRGKKLTDFLSRGGPSLRALLANVGSERFPAKVEVEVSRKGTVHKGSAQIVPFYGSGGEVGGLLVVLSLTSTAP